MAGQRLSRAYISPMHTHAADCSRQPATGTLLEKYTHRLQSAQTTILHRNFQVLNGSVPLDPLLAHTTQQNKPNTTSATLNMANQTSPQA